MTEQKKDGFNPDAYKSNLISEQKSSRPLEQFQLGSAMISQKKLSGHGHDISAIKEVLTELQIYVQKHNVQLSTKVVDEIKLKVAMETLTNDMEARFDATFARFDMLQNRRVSDLITTEEL